MAYQVIARKWRPRSFQELVGQDHVSQTLLNSLRRGRLHHALLLTGPRGTGKTSTARILAKALRCPQAQDYIPCQICSECEEIAHGRNVNVMEIDGASHNGVEAMRELRDTVGYRPSSGLYKLYIIDEVHMLSASAFNALLKTLEEPPDHVIFILATTEVHKIPETILSRVQRFDFRCISARKIVAHLQKICEAEQVKFEPEALWVLARQGAGSMRDSQSFLDQALAFTDGDLSLAKVTEVLGLTDRHLLVETLQALVQRQTKMALDCLDKVFVAGYEPRLFLQDLLAQIRHLLMVKLLGDSAQGVVELSDSEIQTLKNMSGQASEEDLHLLFDMALKGSHDLGRAPDARIAFEMVVLRMSSAPRLVNLLPLVEKLNQGKSISLERASEKKASENICGKLPEETSTPVPAPKSMSAPTFVQDYQQNWFDLVKRIQAVNSVIGAQLENCYLHEIKGQQITLGVAPKMKFLLEKLNGPDFKKKLLNYITTFWGPGYELHVVVGASSVEAQTLTPQALSHLHQEAEKQMVRERVEKHPLVQSVQHVFKTEIRSIKEII